MKLNLFFSFPGIGMSAKKGPKKTEIPMVKKMRMCVTLCSRMPRNWGFSPGAAVCNQEESQSSQSQIQQIHDSTECVLPSQGMVNSFC